MIDTRQLDGVYRIAAWMVLGVVLLAVAYAYIWAFKRVGKEGGESLPAHQKEA